MKSALALSFGLAFASATATIDPKGRPSRIQRRHVALRPRGSSDYSGSGSAYHAGSHGSGYAAGGGAAYGGASPEGDQAASSGWMEKSSSEWSQETQAAMGYESSSTESAAHTSSTGWGYGSGSYGNYQGGYDSCIQQCQAQYGGGGMTYAAAATATGYTATGTYSSANATATAAPAVAGNGTALIAGPNQVVVAPVKGDLRMVPFNINVKKGVTIEWIWGAGPHTVTKSSLLSICNATADAPFKSGMQNATFKFPVTIESEETTPYFCGVPTHCQKGMFGLINGAVSTDPAKGYGAWMMGFAKQNPEFKQKWDTTQQACQGTPAESWGSMIDTSQLPDWAHPMAAEAILETRSFYAQNPTILAAQSGNATTADTGPNSTSTSADGSPAAGDNSTSPSPSASGSSGINLTGAAAPSVSLPYTSGLGLALVALGSVLLA
ncbi:hypothetical protein BCR35DRAFT_323870 [Leucosporidium creatinivorum]|uniref:Blue (type 1) copper domain-containing protein n=1 Tax=Leucosporidium creatinivorum TaxID=106004 RepID=A0A1Y2FYR7_9BASI|nr:hypothetical protein BCR35DRAFT_323870 [Leucosporidium creatinivorum]